MRQMHAGRAVVVRIFRNLLKNNLINLPRAVKVAVVGGSEMEPELSIIAELGLEFDVVVFGISSESEYLDLNLLENFPIGHEGRYHLVICCQVLEHLYNVKNSLENLDRLLSPGGYVWINVPTSNKKHLSPKYYSAGYQPDLIQKLIEPFGVELVEMGDVGSKRLYHMTHKQQYWPSQLEHRYPFLRGIHNGLSYFILRFLKNIPRNIQAQTWSPKIVHGTEFSTDTYFFGRGSYLPRLSKRS